MSTKGYFFKNITEIVYFLYALCYNIIDIIYKMAGNTLKAILDIVTAVDGQETQKTWDAICDFGTTSVAIEYRDEQSLVKMLIKDGRAEIERKGDYGLTMSFEEGKATKVILEIAGNVGEISAETYRLGYLLSEKSCMVHLHYALIFSETEKQEINLRLHAKGI